MTGHPIETLAVVAVVLVAGCAGATTGMTTRAPTDTTTATTATGATDGGSVAFYISDERNAIGDFRNLTVTVTQVGFERTADAGGGWAERDVDNATVDLTELQGANATLIDRYDVPNGTFGTVFVYVGAVNATLDSGETVRVKLPSEKLHVQKRFTVGNGSDVEFVFDVTVHEAGESGKYVLRPVVSESGTDVPIEEVGEDRDGRDDDDGENASEGSGDRRAHETDIAANGTLAVELLGNVTRGENVTVAVTRAGDPVPNATVEVNDEVVGTTNDRGELVVSVPAREELEVRVSAGGGEAELEREFESNETG